MTSSNIRTNLDSKADNLTTDDVKEDDHNFLLSIPLLVLTNIVDYLSVGEVISMACVNKYLYDFVRSTYNIKVRDEKGILESAIQRSLLKD